MNLLSALEHTLPSGYTIHEQLGVGATSWVYKAARAGSDECLVVKVLHPGRASADSVDRFLREMQILKKLDHPRIIPILESGEAGGALYFTMPYIPGETLRVRLKTRGPLPVREALLVTRDVNEALAHAHGRGIVHRDVKPENILLGPDRAYLMDFGFADAPSLTSKAGAARDSGLVFGTPEYVSPEQVTGKPAPDWRSDYYSLGCVLYETLAGRPPFTGDTPRVAMMRRLTEPVPSVRAVRPDVSEEVAGLVQRNLQVDRSERFATAGFFRIALDAAIAGVDAV